jgi:hypothetical protein
MSASADQELRERPHDREWWRMEAKRTHSDWKAIAEAAWSAPGWRRAAQQYHHDRKSET